MKCPKCDRKMEYQGDRKFKGRVTKRIYYCRSCKKTVERKPRV